MRTRRVDWVQDSAVVWIAITLLLAVSPAARGEDLFFAASAYAAGPGGSEFVHELEVLNPSSSTASFVLAWLPRGESNLNPLTAELTVGPGQVTRFSNVLSEAFGLGPNVVGALEVQSTTRDLVFHSTILNVDGTATIGQVIPAAPESTGFAGSDVAYILGLAENTELRSNFWCVNTTDLPIVVTAQLIRSDGVQLDVVTIPLPPLSNAQYNRVFQAFSPVEGYIRLSTPTVDGRAICDGVVVSNVSNDPATQPGETQAPAGLELYLPDAVQSATESTSLDLFAPAASTVVRIELLPTGEDNTNPASVDVAISGGHVARLDHVLADAFGYQGTAALRLSATGSVLMASSRTVQATPAGPVSWWVPALPSGDAFVDSDEVALIHLREGAGDRTDIGFVNATAAPLDLDLALFDGGGTHLGSIPVHVPPYGHEQIDGAFTASGHPDVPVGFAVVTTSTAGGLFFASATVTDLATLDAYHVSGHRIRAPLFADGFETGDTTAWSTTVP